MNKAVVLFSGGTDSTSAAVIAGEHFDEVHLLTFVEAATSHSPLPTSRVQELNAKFPQRFLHLALTADQWIHHFSYHRYWKNLFRYHLLNLATPGFSSLSWHCLTIDYCRSHGIDEVFDGLTREATHLPGHADWFHQKLVLLYSHFGIRYSSPVRDWPTPPDRQFMEKLILDYHWSEVAQDLAPTGTTSDFLKSRGLNPTTFYRGSRDDYRQQHDCYPFIVYNIFYFWVGENLWGTEQLEHRLASFFEHKFTEALTALESPGSLPGWENCRC